MLVITLENPRAVRSLLKKEQKLIKGAITPLVSYYGQRLEREVIRSMVEDPKTGRIYQRPGGRLHQASAPGEAPAVDTGALRDSIRSKTFDGGWNFAVQTNSPYAGYLEGGTTRMRPRPYMQPALERIHNPFREAVTRMIQGRTT